MIIVENHLSPMHAEYISAQSRTDEVLKSWVPDDAERRFPTAESVGEYLESQNRMFWLKLNEDDPTQVDGIVWLKPQDNEHTFAMRMYEPGRGKRLAARLAGFALQIYRAEVGLDEVISLDVNPNNSAAIQVYRNIGFQEDMLVERDGKMRLRMTLGSREE